MKEKIMRSIFIMLSMVLVILLLTPASAKGDGNDNTGTPSKAGFKVSGHAGTNPDEPKNDVNNHRIKANMYMYVDEESNLKTKAEYDAAVEAGTVTPETSGTWYLLLPKNMTPDMSSVSLRSSDRIIEKETYDNFRNSGRTLLVVRGTLSPNVSNDYSLTNGFTDRILLSLDAYLPWEDYVKLDGLKYVNYFAAFESGNPCTLGNLPSDSNYYQSIGYPDAWPSNTNSWLSGADSDIKPIMTDLDPDTDEERFVYLYGSICLGGFDFQKQVEFRKDVRAGSTDAWGKGTKGENHVTVTEGGNYTYRMTVAAEYDKYIGGIMFYDAIEEFVPGDEAGLNEKKNWSGDWNEKGQWKGTLVSVDMTELYVKGFVPWVYYTTQTGLQFGAQGSIDATNTIGILRDFNEWDDAYDLFNSNLWKRVPDGAIVNGVWTVPEGTKVAAIAVDAQRGTNPNSPCLLAPGDKVSVYLNMRAPSDGGAESKWNAKGAYAHKTDNASTSEDIDWTAAMDPTKNMYAYNKAAAVYLRFSAPTTQASHGYARDRTVLNFEYTRVGIVPETISVRATWNDSAYVSGTGNVDNHDGKRPESVTVHLKGVPKLPYGTTLTEENNTTFEDTLVLSADNNWQGLFSNAPALDRNGVPYAYTVTEESVTGYTTSVYKENIRSYEIVNKHETETVTITGKVLWLNPDGTPAEPDVDSLEISLKCMNKQGEVESIPQSSSQIIIPASKDNDWTYTFSGFNRYAPGGDEYRYVLTETAPDGWFSQNATPPVGVDVTIQYDANDLTSFRNFKTPNVGNIMVAAHVRDVSRPKAGNNTVLPSFTFGVDLKYNNAVLTGEYKYVIYDKAPDKYDSTTLPAEAVKIGSGTIKNGGKISLAEGQCFMITGLPTGTVCTISEQIPAGWENKLSPSYYEPKTVSKSDTKKVAFLYQYSAKALIMVTGTHKLKGREQLDGEFSFEIIDDNEYLPDGSSNWYFDEIVATGTTGQSLGTVTEGDGTKTGLAMFSINCKCDNSMTLYISEFGSTETLYYKISEIIPERAQTGADGTKIYNNVTYDGKTQRVAVTFTDNKDGTLKVTTKSNNGELVFTNVYHFEKKITLTSHMELVGRELKAEEFSFEVRRADVSPDSEPIATGKNDANGNIIFSPEITLTEKDLDNTLKDSEVAEVTFLISEVQGSDPTVAYLTTPVEAKVQLALKKNGELVIAMPGQTIKHQESKCIACGGNGKLGGLSLVMFDLDKMTAGEIINLNSYFNDEYFDINGDEIHFKACPHTNFNTVIGYCPDCLYDIPGGDKKAIHLPTGRVLVEVDTWGMSMEEICKNIGVDQATFPTPSSDKVIFIICYPEEDWLDAAMNRTGSNSYANGGGFVYIVDEEANITCPVCHGNKVTYGEVYPDGNAQPVQLTNYLKTDVVISANVNLDGSPASQPFDFVLMESDEYGNEGKKIDAKTSGKDGKVTFATFKIDPNDTATHYYVIREIAGTDTSVIYDTQKALVKVTVSKDSSNKTIAKIEFVKGSKVFKNSYKDGELRIAVNMTGYTDSGKVTFPVTVSLNDGKDKRTLLVEGGKTVVIKDLPHGTAYEIEQPENGIPKHFTKSSVDGVKGSIRGGTVNIVTITYTYDPKKTDISVKTLPEASAITEGVPLAKSSITGGTVISSEGGEKVPGTFKWEKETELPSVSDSNKTKYAAIFTPDDAEEYNSVKIYLTVNVTRKPVPDPVKPVPDPVPDPVIIPKTDDDTERIKNTDGSVTVIDKRKNEDGTVTESTVREWENGNKNINEVIKDEDGNIISTFSETIRISKKGTKTDIIEITEADGYHSSSTVKTYKSGKTKSSASTTFANGAKQEYKETKNADGTLSRKVLDTNAKGKTTLTVTSEVLDENDHTLKKTVTKFKLIGTDSMSLTTVKVDGDTAMIPKTVTFDGHKYKVTTLSKKLFKNAEEIKEIYIYDSLLEKITKGAFYGVSSDAKFYIKADAATCRRIAGMIKRSGYGTVNYTKI